MPVHLNSVAESQLFGLQSGYPEEEPQLSLLESQQVYVTENVPALQHFIPEGQQSPLPAQFCEFGGTGECLQAQFALTSHSSKVQAFPSSQPPEGQLHEGGGVVPPPPKHKNLFKQ